MKNIHKIHHLIFIKLVRYQLEPLHYVTVVFIVLGSLISKVWKIV